MFIFNWNNDKIQRSKVKMFIFFFQSEGWINNKVVDSSIYTNKADGGIPHAGFWQRDSEYTDQQMQPIGKIHKSLPASPSDVCWAGRATLNDIQPVFQELHSQLYTHYIKNFQ